MASQNETDKNIELKTASQNEMEKQLEPRMASQNEHCLSLPTTLFFLISSPASVFARFLFASCPFPYVSFVVLFFLCFENVLTMFHVFVFPCFMVFASFLVSFLMFPVFFHVCFPYSPCFY